MSFDAKIPPAKATAPVFHPRGTVLRKILSGSRLYGAIGWRIGI